MSHSKGHTMIGSPEALSHVVWHCCGRSSWNHILSMSLTGKRLWVMMCSTTKKKPQIVQTGKLCKATWTVLFLSQSDFNPLQLTCCPSPPGTPVSDTTCDRCPAGHFSGGDSASEACQRHRNCSDLGLKTLRWGTSTSNSLCDTPDKTATLECSQRHTLCHTGNAPIPSVAITIRRPSRRVLGLMQGGIRGRDCFYSEYSAHTRTHKQLRFLSQPPLSTT